MFCHCPRSGWCSAGTHRPVLLGHKDFFSSAWGLASQCETQEGSPVRKKSYHDRGPRRAGEPRETLLWEQSGVRAGGWQMAVTGRDSHRARRAILRAGMATAINTSRNLVGSTSQRKSMLPWWANSRAWDKRRSESVVRRWVGGSSREQHGAALAAVGLSRAWPAGGKQMQPLCVGSSDERTGVFRPWQC